MEGKGEENEKDGSRREEKNRSRKCRR